MEFGTEIGRVLVKPWFHIRACMWLQNRKPMFLLLIIMVHVDLVYMLKNAPGNLDLRSLKSVALLSIESNYLKATQLMEAQSWCQ